MVHDPVNAEKPDDDHPPLARVIELWSLLARGVPPALCLDRLEEAATFGLELRFPLFGRVGDLSRHADPAVRAVAMKLLAGASGPIAWQQLLAGLDDADPLVREAAAVAFRASAEHDPPRLAHAIFHANPDVRKQTCELPWLAAATPLYLQLLADEVCRAIVIDRMFALGKHDELVQHAALLVAVGELDRGALLAILPVKFRRLGYDDRLWQLVNELEREQSLPLPLLFEVAVSQYPGVVLAREHHSALSAGQLDDLILCTQDGPARSPEEVNHLLQTARSDRGLDGLHKPPQPDALDAVVDLFWNLAADQRPPAWSAGCGIPDARSSDFPSWDDQRHFAARLVAAVCYAAHRHQSWNAPLTILAAKLDPRMLVLAAVPAEIRAEAARQIAAIPEDDQSFDHHPWVTTLIRKQATLIGRVDLTLLAALARFISGKRLATVVEAITIPVLAAAAREDAPGAIALLLLADDPHLVSELLQAIASRGRVHTLIAARLAFHCSAEAFAALTSEWNASELARTALEIGRLQAQGHAAAQAAELAHVGYLFGHMIRVNDRARHWLESAWTTELSRDLPFARRLWAAISAAHNHPSFTTKEPSCRAKPTIAPLAPPASAEELTTCTDLGTLAAWCASDSVSLAEDAAARLFELGESGIQGLLQLIAMEPALPHWEPLAWTITLWPAGVARKHALPYFDNPQIPTRARLLVGLALLEHGCDIFAELAALATTATSEPWFLFHHFTLLRDRDSFALALHFVRAAASWYADWALRQLEDATAWLSHPEIFDELIRRSPARISFGLAFRLWQDRAQPRPGMFPLLMHCVVGPADQLPNNATLLLGLAQPVAVDEFVTAALTAGNKLLSDEQLLKLIEPVRHPLVRVDALRQIVIRCSDSAVRSKAAVLLQQTGFVSPKFRKIVDVCVWGVRLSRMLFGHDISIRLLGADRLGYTQLTKPVIYVSVLPLLSGERNGKAIVEGLILHEFGHHLYHKTPEHLAVSETAGEEKLHALLNLVNDEHLERNLRAIDRGYGDRLKKLASYAFQHLEREFQVEPLIARLGPHAFRVLTTSRVKFARQAGHIKLESGHVLQELERHGASFARFFRGLRMGLGNRHSDPKVEQGLALFEKDFRHSTADEQLNVSRKLREIFQDEADLLDSFEHGSGVPHEEVLWETLASGVSDEQLQAAVDEQLKLRPPPPAKRNRDDNEPGLEPQEGINRSGDDQFDKLNQITQSPHDPAKHAVYANQVTDEARRLREYLRDLGRRNTRERFRVIGTRFDASRAAALIIKKDPRVMLARKQQKASDLFLAVLVDCSTSMSGERIEYAKRFATLVSEAVRGLPDIDVRNFGFTHDKIIEAGDAIRCGVHGLVADGGNNDAGALWHAAKAALRSKRKAKVLVMISDGAPTSCSVGALKNLVLDLTRRQRMVCAQVAVAPLSDVCFPYHVVLNPQNWQESTQRFGKIVAGLVGKALG